MKLKKGDSISELTLPSVDGSTFNLESIQGKKAMISFYRYSSCPICHLRINEIISKKSENILSEFLYLTYFSINRTIVDIFRSSILNLQ